MNAHSDVYLIVCFLLHLLIAHSNLCSANRKKCLLFVSMSFASNDFQLLEIFPRNDAFCKIHSTASHREMEMYPINCCDYWRFTFLKETFIRRILRHAKAFDACSFAQRELVNGRYGRVFLNFQLPNQFNEHFE